MLALFPGGLIFQGTFLRFQYCVNFVFELQISRVYWFAFEFREIEGPPLTFTSLDYFFKSPCCFKVSSCCSLAISRSVLNRWCTYGHDGPRVWDLWRSGRY